MTNWEELAHLKRVNHANLSKLTPQKLDAMLKSRNVGLPTKGIILNILEKRKEPKKSRLPPFQVLCV